MASQLQNFSSEQQKPTATEKILVPEVNALRAVLKDTVIKTGQLLSLHADAHKSGIRLKLHAQKPPHPLTAALRRNLEKYDQLYDSLDAQILRAISVLERDLRREEERIAAEERQKQPVACSSPVLNGRRPSAGTIYPLSKGLASPATLAPSESATPTGSNDFPPDFLAALGSDPTQLNVSRSSVHLALSGGMEQNSHLTALGGVGLGDSFDNPIELDLDAMDIDFVN